MRNDHKSPKIPYSATVRKTESDPVGPIITPSFSEIGSLLFQ